jgi:hypothetical protein
MASVSSVYSDEIRNPGNRTDKITDTRRWQNDENVLKMTLFTPDFEF